MFDKVTNKRNMNEVQYLTNTQINQKLGKNS